MHPRGSQHVPIPLQSALRLEDGVEEPPAGGRKERRKTDEGRRGWRAQGGCAELDSLQSPESPGSPSDETLSTPKEPPIEDGPELSIPVE